MRKRAGSSAKRLPGRQLWLSFLLLAVVVAALSLGSLDLSSPVPGVSAQPADTETPTPLPTDTPQPSPTPTTTPTPLAYGLSLDIWPGSLAVPPGSRADYTFSVLNSRQDAAVVILEASDSNGADFTSWFNAPDWTATGDHRIEATVPAGGSLGGWLAVVPNNGTLAGLEDVASVSLSAPEGPTGLALTVTTTVAPAYGLALSVDPAAGAAAAGGTVYYDVHLRNTGNTTDSADLNAEASPAGSATVSLSPASLTDVAPGDEAVARLEIRVADDASVGTGILVTVRADSQASGATADATALTEVASATFRRTVSGPDVIGSRVPPERVLEMEVTVTATTDVSALVDYLPSSWTVADARGGAVTAVDVDTTRIAWQVNGANAGSPVTRTYTVASPPEESPPLSYPFWSAAEFSGEIAGGTDYILVSEPPPAPTGLAAELVVPDGVRLTWNASPGAVAYHVYRDGEMVASVDGTEYMESGATLGSTHTYQVAAYDDYGEGPLSEALEVTADDPHETDDTGVTCARCHRTHTATAEELLITGGG
jgi:hypothetical protein